MTNDTRKLAPVELSSLDVIDEPSGFWVFVSREDNGVMTSGRYLFDDLEKFARQMQLERRISITMETDDHEIFVGEEMTIYKVESKNISSFSINGKQIENFNTKPLDEKLEKGTVAKFHITRPLTDSTAYLFVFAKAKLID
ncbi:MAG: hypothetical protein E6767_02470 [Dysgonomonas sp.]|nr:hypothetical protein [Dysgonomonas sp.]